MIIFQVPSPTPEDYRTSFDPNGIDFMNTFFSNALPDSKEDASYEVKKINIGILFLACLTQKGL